MLVPALFGIAEISLRSISLYFHVCLSWIRHHIPEAQQYGYGADADHPNPCQALWIAHDIAKQIQHTEQDRATHPWCEQDLCLLIHRPTSFLRSPLRGRFNRCENKAFLISMILLSKESARKQPDAYWTTIDNNQIWLHMFTAPSGQVHWQVFRIIFMRPTAIYAACPWLSPDIKMKEGICWRWCLRNFIYGLKTRIKGGSENLSNLNPKKAGQEQDKTTDRHA